MDIHKLPRVRYSPITHKSNYVASIFLSKIWPQTDRFTKNQTSINTYKNTDADYIYIICGLVSFSTGPYLLTIIVATGRIFGEFNRIWGCCGTACAIKLFVLWAMEIGWFEFTSTFLSCILTKFQKCQLEFEWSHCFQKWISFSH